MGSLYKQRNRAGSDGRALITLAALALSGCAATSSQLTWTKMGAGPEDLARDRYACIQESRTPWSGSSGGSSGAGVAQGGTGGEVFFYGAARRAQSEANRLFDACMMARGWH
jgi:hypothetical protein